MGVLMPAIECEVCTKWIADFASSPDEMIVTTKIFPRWVRDSAEAGCPICLSFVDLYLPISTHERGDMLIVRQSRGEDPSSRFRISLDMESDAPFLPTSIFCGKDLPCPWGIFPPGNEIISASGPPSCARIASRWIQNCVKEHDCGSTGNDQALPSRLIKIGKKPTDLKLVETDGKRGRYVCLSHCWGVQRTFDTTEENIADRMKRIEYRDLPTTYQDAVTLAKMIGVSYLWIDSLCILQNSRDDWLREAGRMADIYANCFLTLAATSGSTNSAGMFHSRYDEEARGTTAEGLLYCLISHNGLAHPSISPLYGEADRFPLLVRAWVFQERLLSPRVLHFGSGELLWECHAQFICECGDSDGIGLSKAGYTALLATSTEEQLAIAWRDFVEQYSTKRLTRASDKLPAFSGIAKQFASQRSYPTYLAGLWSSSLLDDLLWISGDSYYERHNKPEKWRAPSWSWAAIDGRVRYLASTDYYGRSTVDYVARYPVVQRAHCVPEGENSYGEVTAGWVSISGPVLRGSYKPREKYNRYEYYMTLNPPDGTTGTLFSTEILEDSHDKFSTKSRENRIYFDYQSKQIERRPPSTVAVSCLRMAQVHRTTSHSLRAEEYCLILVCRNEEKKQYERIGMAVIEKEYHRKREEKEDSRSREERFKPIEFTAAEKDALWQEFKSPFENNAQQQIITII